MFTKPDDGFKRIEDRLDVLWSAEATIDGVEYPCKVTNVSTAGALMKLDIDLLEKTEFLLKVTDLGEYAAEVAWANRPFYGLRLLVGMDMKLKDHADVIGLEKI